MTRKSNQAVLVTRWCPKCGCDTPHYTRGRACQPCRARQSREKYAADIEAGREKSRESMRRRRVADPEKFRVKQRARNGLPGPTRPCPEFCEWPGCTRKAECLDHCHDTDAFRGWLCHTHNRGLGQIGDTIVDMRAGVDYLTRAESEMWLYTPGYGLPISRGVA